MKLIFRYYIPSVCIIFTLCIICSAGSSFLLGLDQYTLDRGFLISFLLFIILLHGMAELLECLPFKTRTGYLSVIILLQFTILIIINWLSGWIRIDAWQNMLYLSVSYLLVFFLHQSYFRHLRQLEADEINRLLQR